MQIKHKTQNNVNIKYNNEVKLNNTANKYAIKLQPRCDVHYNYI